MSKPVKDVDRGWNKLLARFKKHSTGKAVSIGVQGEEAQEEHGEAMTNVSLGTIHEFGSKDGAHPPARSHWRSTFDEKMQKYQKELDRIAKATYDPDSGEGTVEGDLLLLGEQYKADVIDKIRSGIPPILADFTLAHKKGETTPLIDTGQYIGSFSAVLVDPSKKREG